MRILRRPTHLPRDSLCSGSVAQAAISTDAGPAEKARHVAVVGGLVEGPESVLDGRAAGPRRVARAAGVRDDGTTIAGSPVRTAGRGSSPSPTAPKAGSTGLPGDRSWDGEAEAAHQ